MACLSALTSLRRLEIDWGEALPSTLPAMTWLECLRLEAHDEMSADNEEPWQQTEAAALEQLARLSTLALNTRWQPNLAAIAQLPQLQRLCIGDPMPNGPWLAQLRWLGLDWEPLEGTVRHLRAAPRLKCVCSLSDPFLTDAAAWQQAWDFFATHPPLRCFYINSTPFGQSHSACVLDAVQELQRRRPALLVRRKFESDLFHTPDLP